MAAHWKDGPGAGPIHTRRHCRSKFEYRVSIAGDFWVYRSFLSKGTDELTLLSRWEYLQSLHIEYALVCGHLAFRLSLVRIHILFGSASMTTGEDPLHSWANLPPRVPHSGVSIEGPWPLVREVTHSFPRTAQPEQAHTRSVSLVYVSPVLSLFSMQLIRLHSWFIGGSSERCSHRSV